MTTRRLRSARFLELCEKAVEQHFLTDPEKLSALASAAGITPDDRVLELGSGGGTVAAALPPCHLTLVELDAALAESLQGQFPEAAVIAGDAIAALEKLEADIILSNLPHALTSAVLEKLKHKTFKRALVAVHEKDDINALSATFDLKLEPLLMLNKQDFTPPQPFRSRLLSVTRH